MEEGEAGNAGGKKGGKEAERGELRDTKKRRWGKGTEKRVTRREVVWSSVRRKEDVAEEDG